MDSGRDEDAQDDPRDVGGHADGHRVRPRTRSRSLTEEQALGQPDLDVEGQAHAVSQSDTSTTGVASARSRLAVRLHEAAGEVHGHRPAPDASTSSSEAAEAPQGGDGLVDCARHQPPSLPRGIGGSARAEQRESSEASAEEEAEPKIGQRGQMRTPVVRQERVEALPQELCSSHTLPSA